MKFYYEGVLQQKSIVKDRGNCAFENLVYNKEGQLTAMYIQVRKTN